jgi:hypothetical protein
MTGETKTSSWKMGIATMRRERGSFDGSECYDFVQNFDFCDVSIIQMLELTLLDIPVYFYLNIVF